MTAQDRYDGRWPEWLKVAGDFINRVGFPIVMAILMFWLANNSIENLKKQTAEVVITLTKLCQNFDSFKEEVKKDHRTMEEAQEMIKGRWHQ